MNEPAPTPTPAPAPPAPGPAPTTWYEGKADAEIVGHWQNRSLDLADPAKVAIEMTKAHRAAERMIGVPAERLIRLPADAKDEAGWKEVWTRLGAPADAKDYDFAAVKNAAGQPIDTRLADAIRAAAAASHLPKDAAATLAAAVVKHSDAIAAEQTAVATAKLADEKAALVKNWGQNFDFNHLKAMEGARRLGITPEAVKVLENQIGYAATMEAMRKIGAGTAEDAFHEGSGPAGAMTQQGAQARMMELQSDREWAKRLLAGDPAAKREFDSLSRLATGITEMAA